MSDNKQKVWKLIFFGDSTQFISYILFDCLLETLRNRQDIKLVAVVDTSITEVTLSSLNRIKYILKYFVIKIFNPQIKIPFIIETNFLKIAKRKNLNVKILIPHNKNINSKEFIEKIKELKPEIAFVAGCPQKFSSSLLKVFKYAVNYHNSLLPKYRGLYATCFSILFNEKETGFSFHFMNEKFDDGPLILQDSIEIYPNSTWFDLELKKLKKACNKIEDVLNFIVSGKKRISTERRKKLFWKKRFGKVHNYKEFR